MAYGVEIWGWREGEGTEKLEERYLRWVLGVGYRTPWYMVREELQREKLRGKAGKRAWGFERKLEEGRGGVARKLLGGDKGKSERRKRTFRMGDGEREVWEKKREKYRRRREGYNDERIGKRGWNRQVRGARK